MQQPPEEFKSNSITFDINQAQVAAKMKQNKAIAKKVKKQNKGNTLLSSLEDYRNSEFEERKSARKKQEDSVRRTDRGEDEHSSRRDLMDINNQPIEFDDM